MAIYIDKRKVSKFLSGLLQFSEWLNNAKLCKFRVTPNWLHIDVNKVSIDQL